MPQVFLRDGKQFECETGISLVEAARHGGLALEHSCRTGLCGSCRARVTSGETKPIAAETSLSAADRSDGWILTCCRSAVSDVSLDIGHLDRLADIASRIVPCRIVSIHHPNASIATVVLRLPPHEPVHYLPGQYLNVMRSGIRRSYSIANSARADRQIHIHVRRVFGGAMSKYWFETARPNDLIRIEFPIGTFHLRDVTAKSLVFIATGTGIAPIKAIVESIEQNPSISNGANINIYWGNRHPDEFYWEPPANMNIFINKILSKVTSEWGGRVGYVQSALLEDGINMSESTVYACGSVNMIDSARLLLLQNGLPADEYYSDAFVSSL